MLGVYAIRFGFVWLKRQQTTNKVQCCGWIVAERQNPWKYASRDKNKHIYEGDEVWIIVHLRGRNRIVQNEIKKITGFIVIKYLRFRIKF